MSLSRVSSCFLIVAGASVVAAGFQGGGRGSMFFEGARLIVGDGSAPIESSAFLVEGDSFTWVGKKGERQPAPGAVRVDLTGKTVIPGLYFAEFEEKARTSAYGGTECPAFRSPLVRLP